MSWNPEPLSEQEVSYYATELNLTTDQVLEFKQVFDEYMEDLDGALTRKNIGNLVRAVGLNPSKSDLHAIIKQADADGSGDLDFEEFMIIVAQVIAMTPTPSPEEYERDMRELFEAIDLDGSGFISSRELIVALSTKGPEPMEPDEVKKVLGRIDKDGDGKMNFREFCKIMDG
ncbi:Calmodulin [Symbiodinium microadriaticum]|uniref:Calmodulin n=1 Tax=Symbiodinium microadriaticum TaxID=2951 RepID=A0A1Q9CM98_SYMMI|nr:Calmodulin [Symbiodinium microadriaticum]CAE7844359.1 calA [Symbiodinium microadriaticum]